MVKFKLDINKYPLEAVFFACSWFMDKYYVFLDLSQDKLEITFKPKGKGGVKKIQENFFDCLEKENLYLTVDKKNKKLKNYIVKQSLLFVDDVS